MSLLNTITALGSTIDQKVKFIHQKPQAGSNAWEQVVFNDYCYERLQDPSRTEVRTRAMFDLMGQAAQLLAKEDPEGRFSMRSFYKNQKGENVPRLHITIRPASAASASASPTALDAELAKLTEQLAKLGFDFNTVPMAVCQNTAAYAGFLKAALARYNSQAVQQEVKQVAEAKKVAEEVVVEEAPDL